MSSFSVFALFLAMNAWGQSEAAVRTAIEKVAYPPLARQARLAAEVHLNSHSDGIMVVSGHPLFVPSALENAQKLKLQADIDIVYHFLLTESGTQNYKVMVKRGNVVGRLLLRALGLRTEKTIDQYSCEPTPGSPPRVEIAPSLIEVWVFSGVVCLTTEASQIASR